MTHINIDIPPGYLRVTQVLEPYSKLHLLNKSVVENAADRGSRVHKFCTMHVLNLLVIEPDPDCKPYVDAFIQWYDTMVTKLIMEPTRINSPKYRISGEFDMIVQIKGDDKITLLDLKTPASPSPSWQLQTAAYKMLVEDEVCQVIDRRIALMLPKEGGSCKVVEYTDHANDLQLYLNALQLYRYFNG